MLRVFALALLLTATPALAVEHSDGKTEEKKTSPPVAAPPPKKARRAHRPPHRPPAPPVETASPIELPEAPESRVEPDAEPDDAPPTAEGDKAQAKNSGDSAPSSGAKRADWSPNGCPNIK